MINRRRVCGGKKGLLPAGYTQLEYIENPSTAYIDTGIVYNEGDYPTIDIEFLLTEANKTHCSAVTGMYRNSGGTKHLAIEVFKQNVYLTLNKNDSFADVPYDGSKCHVVLNANNGSFINEQLMDFGYYALSVTSYSIPLFTRKPGTAPLNLEVFKGKVYRAKYYRNGEIIRDFIPCKNPQNVVGMYDIANDVFYQSASSTAFVAGSEV